MDDIANGIRHPAVIDLKIGKRLNLKKSLNFGHNLNNLI